MGFGGHFSDMLFAAFPMLPQRRMGDLAGTHPCTPEVEGRTQHSWIWVTFNTPFSKIV